MKRIIMVVTFAIGAATLAISQITSHAPDHAFFQLRDMKWTDGPASLSKGAKIALLEGNPSQEGPFTIRLQLPDGFIIQPHWHPAVEHVTVISGTFNIRMGEKLDTSAGHALTPGAFAFMPPGMRHFAWTKGETVIQLHGMGPWKINYVNPADDPRNQK
jgi:quercetin dioxygenase-like cupin family protein